MKPHFLGVALVAIVAATGVGLIGIAPASATGGCQNWMDVHANIDAFLPPSPAKDAILQTVVDLDFYEANGTLLELWNARQAHHQATLDALSAGLIDEVQDQQIMLWFNEATALLRIDPPIGNQPNHWCRPGPVFICDPHDEWWCKLDQGPESWMISCSSAQYPPSK